MDTITRKIFKVSLQFLPEPTVSELSSSEQHVYAVMNTKVCDASIWVAYDGEGKAEVTVPGSTPDRKDWREEMGKEAKILDACLQSDSISVGAILATSLRTSRQAFERELTKQRAVLCGSSSAVSRGSGLFPTSRNLRSRSFLQPMKRSTLLRSRQFTPIIDWKPHMLAQLLSKNQEIDRSVREFLLEVTARRGKPSEALGLQSDKEEEYLSKMRRAKNYEKLGAVSPVASISRQKVSGRMVYRLLRDAIETYFPAGVSLERRVKFIHSVRVIQAFYRRRKAQRKVASVLLIQVWLRTQLARLALLYSKFAGFRRAYFAAKLQHWYPLLVSRYREKRSSRRRKFDFSCFQVQITTIQKYIRRYLVQNRLMKWVKELKTHRERRKLTRFRRAKVNLWEKSLSVEKDSLQTATAIDAQVADCMIMVKQGRQMKGFQSEKEMMDYMRSLEKAAMASRKQSLWTCASIRSKEICRND